MAKHILQIMILFTSFVVLYSISDTNHLQSSQLQILLHLKLLLNSPPFLRTLNGNTDYCNIEPTKTLTVVCYEQTITQLHIVGDLKTPRLPDNFSIDSFITTLIKLPRLKGLTLASLGLWGPLPCKFTHLSSLEILNLTSNYFQGEISSNISSLVNLHTLVLENNNFTGNFPVGIGSLSNLAVFNLKNNYIYGSLPKFLENLVNLRILVLSNNKFSGQVPDFSGLTNLQVLDLENNFLGPQFPITGEKIERLMLKNNKFFFGLPEKVESYYRLRVLDISSNRLIGPFPVSILSLPSINYIDISVNKFTGTLSENLACNNDGLYLVNFTNNLLTGKLPRCLVSGLGKRVVLYGENCLSTGDENQHPLSFCKNEALAVGILPRTRKRKALKVILGLSIFGGVIVSVVLVGSMFLVVKNFLSKRDVQRKQLQRSTAENASTSCYASKILKDARYITRAMKLGGPRFAAYRTFSVEELQQATNNFNTSAFMGECSHGQMYRGQLRDGSNIAIKCLKLKRNHSSQYYMPHIEIISKLRHQHLVSALGYCFEYYLDDSSVSRFFLVFEYVPYGTLRSWISGKRTRRKLTWSQRIAAVIGVAKGIQFLHTGIVPGLFVNNIKITDILIDQQLVTKISSYNLALLSDNMGKDRLRNYLGGSKEFKRAREKHQDKLDIHDFGVILLEVISGKPINSRYEFEAVKYRLEASIMFEDISSNSFVDPAVKNTCSVESAKTMIEICCRCLHEDPAERPSIEDVLWNLQFAAQVQDASQSSDGSSIFPLQSSHSKLTVR
ncbi:hypothetical protein CASFOL_013618 [Castilleja foliolosa]|uniref:Protein kinase domain-containing protein n=1 Tax=Castilleja foliolosa TaxID=1961234 RepID=A0ABD3DKJ3_9LAMI